MHRSLCAVQDWQWCMYSCARVIWKMKNSEGALVPLSVAYFQTYRKWLSVSSSTFFYKGGHSRFCVSSLKEQVHVVCLAKSKNFEGAISSWEEALFGLSPYQIYSTLFCSHVARALYVSQLLVWDLLGLHVRKSCLLADCQVASLKHCLLPRSAATKQREISSKLNIYIFIAIALDETGILVAVHFSVKNIYQSCDLGHAVIWSNVDVSQ